MTVTQRETLDGVPGQKEGTGKVGNLKSAWVAVTSHCYCTCATGRGLSPLGRAAVFAAFL